VKVKTVSEDKKTESNPLGDLNLDENKIKLFHLNQKTQTRNLIQKRIASNV